MHLTENILRAHIDNELAESERLSVAEHLEGCKECSNQIAEIKDRAERIASQLDILAENEPSVLSAEPLLSRIPKSPPTQPRKYAGVARWRPVWAAAVAAMLVVGFAWQSPSVRVWASEFLSLFRVQQIQVVQIDPANVQRLQNEFFDERNRPRLEQLFSDNARVVKRGEPQEVADANQAGKVAGFGVRLPAQLEAQPRLHVQPAVDASFTIDRARLQSLLDDAGRSDIRIPEDADGKTVNINVPASVTAFYGNCPDPAQMKQQDQQESEQNREAYPECKVIAQLPSPAVMAPPSLNVVQLGQAMLQFFGFSPEQAQKFSEQIDWTSTLVLPVPMSRGVAFKEVEVDGVKGTLLTSDGKDSNDSPSYNLLWLRDGILYSAMGHGTAEEAMAIANSMR
jgi:putative zinc finger protein